MDKFTTLTGVAAPINMINVDTDRIIPKNYLKTIKRTGLGKALFAEMRYDEAGRENPEFVLNKGPFRKATILVAGENFGCGSSREHAPVGAPGFRHPLRDRAVVCRHLLQQHLQERHPADHPARSARQRAAALPARAAGRRDHDRSAGADGDGTGRKGRQVRDRCVPQALPRQRPRRNRPDAAEGGAIKAYETQSATARPWLEGGRSPAGRRRRCGRPDSRAGRCSGLATLQLGSPVHKLPGKVLDMGPRVPANYALSKCSRDQLQKMPTCSSRARGPTRTASGWRTLKQSRDRSIVQPARCSPATSASCGAPRGRPPRWTRSSRSTSAPPLHRRHVARPVHAAAAHQAALPSGRRHAGAAPRCRAAGRGAQALRHAAHPRRRRRLAAARTAAARTPTGPRCRRCAKAARWR